MQEIEPCPADEEFVRAHAGEHAAFGALVRRHQRLVFSIALRMLGDRPLAEDLSQEVFLQMHRSLRSIESGAHLGFWLRRVTAHRAIDRLRQRKGVDMTTLEAASHLPAATGPEEPLLRGPLERLVGELSPVARAVVLLRYQEDLDPGEIARTLDIPLNTVKSHLKRSLASLRVKLSGNRSDAKVAGHDR
ncbi:MAG: RNA polymerase sigma factor [Steroidobacteraceae bacterium]